MKVVANTTPATPAERLVKVRAEAGFSSAAEAAESFGWKYVTYAAHENGTRGIRAANAEKYASAFRTSPHWILFGDPRKPAKLGSVAVGVSDNETQFDKVSRAEIPIFDVQIAAGDGAYIDSAHQTGLITFDRSWLSTLTASPPSKLSVLQLDGNSMEPTIPDGSWVMIDRNDTRLTTNRIYAFREEDEARIKRVSKHPGRNTISLISDNPQWPDSHEVDPDSLIVYGRVIWFSKKI